MIIENFFRFFNRDKGDKVKDEKKKKPVRTGIFSKKDDDLAKTIYNSLKESIEKKDGRVKGIYRYQDYKRVVQFKGKSKDYNIVVQRDSRLKNNYVLIVNNKSYTDKLTHNGTVSQSLCRKIWDLLDKEYNKSYYDKDNIKNDFE